MHSRCESGTGNEYIKSLKVCVSVFARLHHQILAWLLSTILLAVIKTPTIKMLFVCVCVCVEYLSMCGVFLYIYLCARCLCIFLLCMCVVICVRVCACMRVHNVCIYFLYGRCIATYLRVWLLVCVHSPHLTTHISSPPFTLTDVYIFCAWCISVCVYI